MVRRKSLGRDYVAEGYFPVRVRVAVPPGGFGNQLNLIYAWLDQQIGKERREGVHRPLRLRTECPRRVGGADRPPGAGLIVH